MYRLQELDSIAIEEAGTRDAAEVRMAYRLRLGEELDLPLRPKNMLFERYSGVSQRELDRARDRVLNGETREPFLTRVMRFGFWTQYMVELGRSRFDELEAQYRESVTILEDEAEHIDHDRLVALKRAHDERVAQLYRELTLMTINQYLPR
jgi:hypothetical protein